MARWGTLHRAILCIGCASSWTGLFPDWITSVGLKGVREKGRAMYVSPHGTIRSINTLNSSGKNIGGKS